jgi:hypothetical protein
MKLINALRLMFAGLWLATGIALLVYQAAALGDAWGMVEVAGVRFSIGWVALLFGGYNLFRWWNTRTTLAQRKREQELLDAREARWRARNSGEPPPPDPNFDFTSPPGDKGSGG